MTLSDLERHAEMGVFFRQISEDLERPNFQGNMGMGVLLGGWPCPHPKGGA